jgi:hypothetical protein
MSVRHALWIFAVTLFASGSARADVITVADVQACGGNFTFSSCSVGAATVSSSPSKISWKTLSGFTGIGVGGGAVDFEIDGSESLSIDFGGSVLLDSVELVFLYEPPTYGDVEIGPGSDESATIAAYSGSTLIGTASLYVTGFTTATATGGTAVNVSPGDLSGGGVWRWSGMFGAPLTSISFYSADPGPTSAYSDFAIGATTFRRAVPEPSALLLLSAGALAAGLRQRRRG